jgi:organic radical activating enzyme
MSSTYCPLPWIFQAIRNNGQARICCQANVSENRGLLRKADGTIYQAGSDNLDESRNSELMRDARLKMLNGEWPSTCSRCKNEEGANLRSRRIYENQTWEKRYDSEWARSVTNPDGSMDTNHVPPIYFDIRLGNKCNLKCRMCGPTDSDMWYEDYHSVVGDTFSDTQGDVKIEKQGNRWKVSDTSYDWHETDVFWNYLKKHASHIEHLHIVGGEPLLIENHYHALEFLCEHGYASKITLEYNTNLMVLPQKALELWKQFKEVRIGVSIDGIGEVNDYIRTPSKWSTIEKNLRRLDQASPNLTLWLSVTIQIYNVYHVTEMIRWKLESGLKRFNSSMRLPFITSHVLHHPKYLNIRTLPPQTKAKVAQHYADFGLWFHEWSLKNINDSDKRKKLQEKLSAQLSAYLDYMNKEDWSHLLKQFTKYTKDLDVLRKQDFSIIAPELAHELNFSNTLPNTEVPYISVPMDTVSQK